MPFDISPNKREELYNQHLQEISGVEFTFRQVDIIACLVHNRNQAKIAELLSIPSVRTVQAHMRDIKERANNVAIERLIDMVDKSGKRQYIVEYYFNILVQSAFENTLRKVRTLANREGKACSTIPLTAEEDQKLLKQIKKNLKIANIMVADEQSGCDKVTHHLYLLSESTRMSSSISQKSVTDMVLLFDRQIDLSLLQETEYIDFRIGSEYYCALLLLVKKIIDKQNVEQIIQSFKDELESLKKSWSSPLPLHSSSNSQSKNVILNTIMFKGMIGIVVIGAVVYWSNALPQKSHGNLLPNSESEQINEGVTNKIKATSNFLENNSNYISNHLVISNTFPYTKKEVFLERDGVFKQLDKILAHNQYVAITGAPGVGKSSCASEYARLLVHRDNKTVIRSFAAGSNTSIYNEYLNIAKEYGDLDFSKLPKKVIIQRVHNHLADKEKSVFIFDNVEDYNDIAEYIKDMPLNIKLIVTSRNGLLPDTFSNEYRIKLGAFNQEEALTYLKKALHSRIQAEGIGETKLKELIEALGGSTGCMVYKLAEATAWLNEQQLASLDDYIEKHKSGQEDGIEATLLFKLLEKHPDAWQIMQYTSYLDPDFISTKLLSKLLGIDKDKLNEAIHRLQNLSLVELIRRPNDVGIKMHRLTQETIQKYIERHKADKSYIPKKEMLSSLINTVEELMPLIMNDHPDNSWMMAGNIYGSAKQVLAAIRSNEFTESKVIASLYYKLGSYYHHVAHNYTEALTCYKYAEDMYDKIKDQLKRAELLVSQGWCYFAMRRLDESLKSFDQALEILNQSQLQDTFKAVKADALSGKGIICDKKGIDSLKVHLEAYQVYKALYSGQDHSKVATALHNIGWYYRENSKGKDINKALQYFTEAFEIRKKLYPEQNHMDIATSLNSIGTSYIELGGSDNLEKALDYQNQALKMRSNILRGQVNQDLISSYLRLGQTYKSLGQYAKSLAFFEKTIMSTYSTHNTYNYGVIIGAFEKIAGVYEQLGNSVETTEYYKKSYSIIKRYACDNEVNKAVINKITILASEFINNPEARLFIVKHKEIDEETYNIKIKLQEILGKLHNLAKDGKWQNSWFNEGVSKYIDEKQIRGVLEASNSKSATVEEIEIAKILCFEAINIGIMSASEEKRKFDCLLNFAKANPDLINKIIHDFPEYFVDGTLLIKCAKEGIIPLAQAIKAIGEKEYEEYNLWRKKNHIDKI